MTPATGERRAGDVRELGHLVLYAADLDRSLAFYRDLLGWPVVIPPVPYRSAGFRGGAGTTHHDLVLIEVGHQAQPVPAGPHLGMYHFGVHYRRRCGNSKPPRPMSPSRMRLASARSPSTTPSCASTGPPSKRAPIQCSSRAGSTKRRPSAPPRRRGFGNQPDDDG